MAFEDTLVQEHVTFEVQAGQIFIIMGPSGCGKSTLLKHITGLMPPASGDVTLLGKPLWELPSDDRHRLLQRTGVLFQNGALWSGMSVSDNVALPMQLHTDLSKGHISDLTALKLSLVGLNDAGEKMPSELSGGMRKRAGLARALALEPDILFLDEPSAGLDPISARRLDRLILSLRDSLGISIVTVTHEVDSMMTIGDDSIFLDNDSKTIIGRGKPSVLRDQSKDAKVREFLQRSDTQPKETDRA